MRVKTQPGRGGQYLPIKPRRPPERDINVTVADTLGDLIRRQLFMAVAPDDLPQIICKTYVLGRKKSIKIIAARAGDKRFHA